LTEGRERGFISERRERVGVKKSGERDRRGGRRLNGFGRRNGDRGSGSRS
jgi:hypothetical protein